MATMIGARAAFERVGAERFDRPQLFESQDRELGRSDELPTDLDRLVVDGARLDRPPVRVGGIAERERRDGLIAG